MAQRLVRKVHPSARHQTPIDDVTRAFIDQQFVDLDPKYRDALQLPTTMYDVKPSSGAVDYPWE